MSTLIHLVHDRASRYTLRSRHDMVCIRPWRLCLALTLGAIPPAVAQTAAAPPAQAAPSGLNFSGIIFGNYNYQLPTTPAQLPGQTDNQFVLERAYLNFRMGAGDRLSIRITTDVYQTTEGTPNAYAIRAKYAYLQYEQPRSASGAAFLARVGMLNNVVIDHVETFWPRYISQTPVERAGYFSSADVGIAAQYTLPAKAGELYATVVNGPGYTSRERDRFKDFAIRLSLTPLANRSSWALLQSFTLSAWGYKGAVASSFVNGGGTQTGAVGEALDRSRAGVLVGIRDPRLTIAAEYAQRHEDGEQGANTAGDPRVRTGVTGRLLSAFTVVRPFAFATADGKSPFGVVARYDAVRPSITSSGYVTPAAPPTRNAYHLIIAGLFYDVSQKAQFALDYQESLAANNGQSLTPPLQAKTYFAHFSVSF